MRHGNRLISAWHVLEGVLKPGGLNVLKGKHSKGHSKKGWHYVGYIGKRKCPRCHNWAYASKGYLGGKPYIMFRHRKKGKGVLRKGVWRPIWLKSHYAKSRWNRNLVALRHLKEERKVE